MSLREGESEKGARKTLEYVSMYWEQKVQLSGLRFSERKAAILVRKYSKVTVLLLERVRPSQPPCPPCLLSSTLEISLELTV